jgi:hypothetical protein
MVTRRDVWTVRVMDTLATGCRVLDAVICWNMRPAWCRGSLWAAIKRGAAGGR